MNHKRAIFLLINSLILSLIISNIKAQEVLISLDGNPLVRKAYQEQKNKAINSVDTLELPFFDDFSGSDVYPNPNLWSDQYAFINGSYGINPPSVGVATFDAIDRTGEFYEDADYGIPYNADKLTSNPINLDYPGDKNIYLSFMYQPQGLGDYPEEGDSLILEFYAPSEDKWYNIWSQAGSELTSFQNVIKQVYPDRYLKKGFRFRFRNIVSLSSDQQPSRTVNADHWNIDYVKLDRNRNQNDTINDDITFVYPMSSLLKNYESMPWKHFKVDTKSELKSNVYSVLRNNYIQTRLIKLIYWVFHDNSGNELNDTLSGGAKDLEPLKDSIINPAFDNSTLFLTNSVDSASFTITAFIETDTDDPIENNKLSYVQKFYDYYAYDDGTAEAGYGLTGDGTQNALLAYKFDCKKQDTLKAIQMYFNRSLFDKSKKYFYLVIWNDNAGKPGDIIYKREGIMPEYENELNKFHTYYIDDTTLILNRVFYVGWQQTTTDLLNIGFDFNRVQNSKIFYNINGSWENSKFEGALMIRPFFGKSLTTGINPEIKKSVSQVKIYPNPSSDNITIQFMNSTDYMQVTVSIYNLHGSLVHQSLLNNHSTIDLSDLKEGMYIIKLTDKQKLLNYSCKLLKTR